MSNLKVKTVDNFLQHHGSRIGQHRVVIPVSSFNIRMGGTYCTEVEDVFLGIDWDNNKLFIKPEDELYTKEDIKSKLESIGWGTKDVEDFFKKS